MADRTRRALGQIAEFRNGVNFSQSQEGSGIPILKVKDFAALRRAPTVGLDELDASMARVPDTQFLQPRDIIVVRSNGNRELVGRALIYDGPPNSVTFSGFCIRIRVVDQDVYAEYIHYWLRSPLVRAVFAREGGGTAINNLSQSFLSEQMVPLPPKEEQRHIASILGALDDKIELNRRMNETLEAMARAIFKDWFVDFGPTRAKMEGRAPYLAPDIWSLFPDRLDDEGKPEGWLLGSMSDLLLLQRGFDLPSQNRMDGPYPIIAASGPNGSHNAFMVKGPGVTTGRSGVLGKIFFVHQDFWPLNTSLWIKEFRRATPSYAYFYLQNVDFGAYNAGSAVPTLNRNHVHGLPTVLPPDALIKSFDDTALSLLNRQECNRLESDTLASTRDFLLPKLMSGEVRVKDAEKLVGEAT